MLGICWRVHSLLLWLRGLAFAYIDGLVWLPHIPAVSQDYPQYSDPELSVGAKSPCPGFSRRSGQENVPSSLEVLDQSAH